MSELHEAEVRKLDRLVFAPGPVRDAKSDDVGKPRS